MKSDRRLPAPGPGLLPRPGSLRPARHRARRLLPAPAGPRPAHGGAAEAAPVLSPTRINDQILSASSPAPRATWTTWTSPGCWSSRRSCLQLFHDEYPEVIEELDGERGKSSPTSWMPSCAEVSTRGLPGGPGATTWRQSPSRPGADGILRTEVDLLDMANRRAIVKRRKAVRNTKKITRTMQLIATARFPGGHEPRRGQPKPYVGQARRDGGGPLPRGRRATSAPADRGPGERRSRSSHGGAHQQPRAVRRLQRQRAAVPPSPISEQAQADGIETDVHMVGKKGVSGLPLPRSQEISRRDLPTSTTSPASTRSSRIARELIDRFVDGEIWPRSTSPTCASSLGRQAGRRRSSGFCRWRREAADDGGEGAAGEAAAAGRQYEIRPSAEELLDNHPARVRADAAVPELQRRRRQSEQIARMAAMKAATEAAEEMIKSTSRGSTTEPARPTSPWSCSTSSAAPTPWPRGEQGRIRNHATR